MENIYCRELDLVFTHSKVVLNRLIAKCKDRTTNFQMGHTMRDVDPKLSAFLQQFNVRVDHYESFYTHPGSRISVHIDDEQFDNSCKINYVFGGAGSTMSWWEALDSSRITHKTTPIGTKYLYIEPEYSRKVYETTITSKPVLVNVGKFHKVDNPGSEPRYCLSHILWDIDKNQKLQWEDAVVKFKDFLL